MARGTLSFLTVLLVGLASAQTPGPTREVHPKLQTWKCTKRGGCISQKTSIVLDSLAHPVHQLKNPSLGCGDWGNPPNKTVCPDQETCQKNCVVEGVPDYSKYGVTTSGANLYMKQLRADGSTASPRVYLLSEDEKKYEMLKLTGGELTFDVDMSKLPCGMNGALYLVEMDKAGGKNKLNKAGAYYGTGYCDAQCFVTPFINGVGNIAGKGSCCGEMDVWEANKMATQLAPHPCNQTGLYECTGPECAFDGVCDKYGCANNPYNQGADPSYYGPGLKVDTKRPFTVVTQFPANKKGELTEIHRLYVQDGKVIQNAVANVTGLGLMDYMNDAYCEKNGATKFMQLGAMKGMGEALARGMVLTFSIWWDEGGFMQWLDGGASGPCNATEGDPKNIRKIQPDTEVVYSQIKWGEIGSTYTSKVRPQGYYV